MELDRRDMLKVGAGGAVASGLMALGGLSRTAPAAGQSATLGGIHIHGSLKQTEGPGGTFGRIVDINVWGTDDNLNGFGWDANPVSVGSNEPAHPDRTQCFSTQRGSVQGDVVKLMGINLFWQNPSDDGAPVAVEANLTSGAIRWETSPPSATFVFEGTGVVGRF